MIWTLRYSFYFKLNKETPVDVLAFIPSAARGIAMLRADKFLYPRQQTKGN